MAPHVFIPRKLTVVRHSGDRRPSRRAKHLAVVYTANPQTREKGKYFMRRLPALLPTAKLVDMYVSGGKPFNETKDMGFMYNRSFQDPDGHLREMIWMDPAAVG